MQLPHLIKCAPVSANICHHLRQEQPVMSLSGFWRKLYCYCWKTALWTPCSTGEDVQKRTIVWKTPLLLFLGWSPGRWFSFSLFFLSFSPCFGCGFFVLVWFSLFGSFGFGLGFFVGFSTPKIALRSKLWIPLKKKKKIVHVSLSQLSLCTNPLQNHPISKMNPFFF